MVDTHIHASQYSYAGTGLDLTLLQWLNTYTFPVESRFEDLEFARKVYTQVVVSLPGSRYRVFQNVWKHDMSSAEHNTLKKFSVLMFGLLCCQPVIWEGCEGLTSLKHVEKNKPYWNVTLILQYYPFALQKRTLGNGTTTACYFATIHTDASLLLSEITSKVH